MSIIMVVVEDIRFTARDELGKVIGLRGWPLFLASWALGARHY